MTDPKKFFPAALCATALATVPMAAAAGQAGLEHDTQAGATAQPGGTAQTGATTATTADIGFQISQIQTLEEVDNVTVVQVGDALGATPGENMDGLQDDQLGAAPDPQVDGQLDEFGAAPDTGLDAPAGDPAAPGAGMAEGTGGFVPAEGELSQLRDAIEGHSELAGALDEQNVEIDDVVAVEVIGAGDVIVYVRS
jgi:hypothetical protein